MRGISTVICCYNSALRIEETLKHIFNLKILDKDLFEVIIVNNNSADRTKEFALSLEKKYNHQLFTFRVVDEPDPGLSFARIAGVKAASFEVICFCDDDNHLDDDYILEACKILDTNPGVGIVGGLIRPRFSINVGGWIKDFYAAMAIGAQASQDGYVRWVFGAGMIIKKEIFENFTKAGIKLLLSDRAGKILTSGGDSEICMLASFLNYKLYYSSKLILYHAIPENRLTRKHYLRAKYNTIYPSVYLSILDALLIDRRIRSQEVYRNQMLSSIKKLIYFLPRIIIGNHQFYSFFSFYRTTQYLTWCVFNKRIFEETYSSIKTNLKITSQ
jgi:glycosyltransferase involved in cell wall biosynthesis